MRHDLLKTLSFATLHFVVGFGVSYAFTGSIAIASGIALVEPLANTVVFYFHERGWRRLEGCPPGRLSRWLDGPPPERATTPHYSTGGIAFR